MNYLYSQKYPLWANLKVGNSGKNMAQIGCLLTDCSMIISDLWQEEHTPKMLLEWMNKNNGFDAQGDLYWGKIFKYTEWKLKARDAEAGETQYEIYAVWAGKIKHWILKIDENQYADPLSGTIISKSKYPFQGDIRILSGKKRIIMNYENKIIRNQKTGGFALVIHNKKYVFGDSLDVKALLTFMQRSGVDDDKIINVSDEEYNKIPLSDGLKF